MGICLPCLNSSSADYDQPSPETRRRQQAEAAERRQKDMEGRGVKDPEALKRKQLRKEEMERKSRHTAKLRGWLEMASLLAEHGNWTKHLQQLFVAKTYMYSYF